MDPLITGPWRDPAVVPRAEKGRWHVRGQRHIVNLIPFDNISLKEIPRLFSLCLISVTFLLLHKFEQGDLPNLIFEFGNLHVGIYFASPRLF